LASASERSGEPQGGTAVNEFDGSGGRASETTVKPFPSGSQSYPYILRNVVSTILIRSCATDITSTPRLHGFVYLVATLGGSP